MNVIALRFAGAILAVVLLCLLLAVVLGKAHIQRVKAAVSWLLKVSFLDFVQMVIFIKPWKAYVDQTGLLIWLILAYAVGSYMITSHPTITEIPGIFIPAIGYVYFVSILFIMRSVLRVVRPED